MGIDHIEENKVDEELITDFEGVLPVFEAEKIKLNALVDHIYDTM